MICGLILKEKEVEPVKKEELSLEVEPDQKEEPIIEAVVVEDKVKPESFQKKIHLAIVKRNQIKLFPILKWLRKLLKCMKLMRVLYM